MPGEEPPQGIEVVQALDGTDLDTVPAFTVADPDRIDLRHNPPQGKLGLELVGSLPVAKGSNLDQVTPGMDDGMSPMIRASTAFFFRQNDLETLFELRIKGKGLFGSRHGRRSGLGVRTSHSG